MVEKMERTWQSSFLGLGGQWTDKQNSLDAVSGCWNWCLVCRQRNVYVYGTLKGLTIFWKKSILF